MKNEDTNREIQNLQVALEISNTWRKNYQHILHEMVYIAETHGER